jgi:hypothetical protein
MNTHDDTVAALDVTLQPLCTLDIRFASAPTVATPTGTRRFLAASEGVVGGPRLKGTVLPGSADWLLIGDDLVARVDVRAVIQTDDEALIQVTATGRVALGEHLDRFLGGEEVTAEQAYIRTSLLFDTADERYADLNALVTLGFCNVSTTSVRYRVYAVG